MRIRFVALAVILACAGVAQAQKKAPAATSGPALTPLILRGKTADAVKLGTRNPAGVPDSVREILAIADSEVADQKAADAKAKLDSLVAFLDAFAKANKGKDQPREAISARQMRIQGILLANQRSYVKSEEAQRTALALAKKVGDASLEAAIHNNLGFSLMSQAETNEMQADEKLEAAAREFDTARTMAESQKDSHRAASANTNLGQVLIQLRRNEPALEAFRRAEVQFKEAGKPSLEARAVLFQGMALDRINPVAEEPVRVFERAFRMFEKLGEDSYAGWSLFLSADHTAYMQKHAEAAILGERALTYLVRAGPKGRLKACYSLLAEMYGRTGDKAKAEKYKKLADETVVQ